MSGSGGWIAARAGTYRITPLAAGSDDRLLPGRRAHKAQHRRSAMGHEDQFAPPGLSGRSRFCQATFTGTDGNGRGAPEADIVKNCLALTRPSKGQRLLEAPFDNASPPGGGAVQFANGGFSLHWRLAGPHHSPRMDVRPLCSQCRHAIEPRLRRLEFGGER